MEASAATGVNLVLEAEKEEQTELRREVQSPLQSFLNPLGAAVWESILPHTLDATFGWWFRALKQLSCVLISAKDEVVMELLVMSGDVVDADAEEVTGPQRCTKHL